MRDPDINGARWRAWRVPVQPQNPDETASLACWLLHCPGAHPFWSYWTVSLIHLRPIEGGSRPAVKSYPHAEFELMVITIDPNHQPDPDDSRSLHYLRPVDVSEQFHGITDAQAVELTKALVEHVCRGMLSPDSDWRARWREHIEATVEHMTTGHPVGNA